jgi:hypothetical protein
MLTNFSIERMSIHHRGLAHEFFLNLGHRAADGANHTAALGRASADASTFTMDVMDPTTDPVPVIATLPMGGGAVTGPGAGVLHVQWGIGNELRVSRVRGTEPGTAVATSVDESEDVSSGAAYVVQW